jgi:hypothetical protein
MLHRRFGHAHEPDRFESLWASYVHQPPDVHVYLKGDIALGDDLSGWVGVTRPSHMSHDWRIKPLPEDDALDAAGHLDAMQKAGYLLGNDMTGRIKGSWSADALPKMLTGPLHFYYGLCHDDTMLLMMFREPERFRFAYSPEGGGTEPARSPAWDYLLTLDDAKVGAKYVWNLCLAVKRFAGRADVLREVKRYRSTR